MNTALPYGASDHYVGDGNRYFDWQAPGGLFIGKVIARMLQPFVSPSDTVMDFGAGTGALLQNLQCRERIAVEINPVAREFCWKKFKIRAYPDTLEIPTESVDVVLSNHCLEHVPYPIAALKEISRVVKPEGQVVLVLPINDWRDEKQYNPNDINHHLHTWTPLLLGHTLFEAGLDLVETKILTRGYTRRFAPLWRAQRYRMFNLACYLLGWWRRRREMLARCRKRPLFPKKKGSDNT